MVKHPDIKPIWLVFSVLLLTAVYLSNYVFGVNSTDPNEQLPIIKRMLDPTYLSNDWFVNESGGFSIRSFFSYLMAYLGRFAPLPLLYFGLYLLTYLLTVYGAYLLSDRLFKNNLASLFVIFMILFGPKASLGSFRLLEPEFIPRSIATPIVLFGLYYLLGRRYYLSFLLLGVASVFHMVIGPLIAAVSGLYLLLYVGQVGYRRIMVCGIICLAFGGLGLAPVILRPEYRLSDPKSLELLASIIGPHIFYPSHFGLYHYLTFISLAALVALAWKHRPKSGDHKTVLTLSLIILGMGFVGAFFAEVVPVAAIYKLNLFRPMTYLYLFAYVYAANYLAAFINGCRSIFGKALGLAVVVSSSTSIAFFASTLLLLFYLRYLSHPADLFASRVGWRGELRVIAVILSLGILSAYLLLPSLGPGAFNLTDPQHARLFFGLIVFIVLAAAQLWYIAGRPKRVPGYLPTAFALLMIAAVLFGVQQLGGVNMDGPAGDPALADAYEHISQSTTEDSVFIIPPYINNFRLGAKRAIVVDSFAIPLDDRSIWEWRQRISDVSGGVELTHGANLDTELKQGYGSMGEAGFIKAARKYGATYVLVEKPKKLGFNVLYENEKYAVYSLFH